MTLRTPRRRISPRTKRRYRAIREFFRRALGSSSQPDIKISSSIAVNVTELKRKIVGLEQQFDEVNKHCQDIACLEYSRKDSESYIQSEVKHDIDTIKEQTEASSDKKLDGIETKLIYKSSECNFENSEENVYPSRTHDVIDQTPDMMDDYERCVSKVKIKKSKLNKIADYGAKLHKYRTRSVYENLSSAYSTSSFRSLTNPRMNNLIAGYSGHHSDRKHPKQDYKEQIPSHPYKDKKHKECMKRNKIDHYKEMCEQKSNKLRKHKHHNPELDQDFIADIIRKQYKPVKMFGRKESDLSQISAPICRDQEFSIREDIQKGNELCSCCYEEHKHRARCSDLSEMRSICDTRLYSSKKLKRAKHRRMHVDIFNNSDLYDLIPVKEKSSPKTRRKFSEDNMIPREYYREVPPSPRTLRPRLNLKAQYSTGFEDYVAHMKRSCRNDSPYRQKRYRERIVPETDTTSEPIPNFNIEQPRKSRKHMTCQVDKQELGQQDYGTMSNLHYPPCVNEQANVTIDTTFNKSQETEITVDKTDKALCEIKDILQSFLHEIKKESIASQCDKSDISSKICDQGLNVINENSAKLNSNVMHNSRHSFNNYSVGQCNAPPYMTPLTNPYCYPLMCPLNYPMSMQNGFMLPSRSYTCTACANAAKEPVHDEHSCNKNINTNETCHTDTCNMETEELIKEIYKFVAQSPVRKKDLDGSFERHEPKNVYDKILTSRSVGESSKLSKHDAKVGTPPLKCFSKSCEAIGSRMSSDPYSTGTNTSYSDTVLEKISLEVSQSTSADPETETTEDMSKRSTNKFSKVLRSIGLFKKKQKDVIEELSESESTIDVAIKSIPYPQEITNYMTHRNEYYQPPPIPPNYHRPHEYQPDYHPPYNPGMPQYPPPQPMHDIYSPREHHPKLRERATAPPFHPKHRPTAPPYHHSYDNHYNQMHQPQVPLCLKEIEVKSIGTQSERKMSILSKLKLKMQPSMMPDDVYNQNSCSTQTQSAPSKQALTKPLFTWKTLQEKAMKLDEKYEGKNTMNYTMKAQNDLDAGGQNIRSAMMKKMFHKRNPFSPRNLIVRTLLGKDKSSFGDPPTRFKPKMFF